jgi:hypothetical protein
MTATIVNRTMRPRANRTIRMSLPPDSSLRSVRWASLADSRRPGLQDEPRMPTWLSRGSASARDARRPRATARPRIGCAATVQRPVWSALGQFGTATGGPPPCRGPEMQADGRRLEMPPPPPRAELEFSRGDGHRPGARAGCSSDPAAGPRAIGGYLAHLGHCRLDIGPLEVGRIVLVVFPYGERAGIGLRRED